MNSELIYHQFNSIPEPYRMLCIDSAVVACYLYQQGQKQAGIKLLHTVITTAGLQTDLIETLLDNLPESVDALAAHAEIRNLK